MLEFTKSDPYLILKIKPADITLGILKNFVQIHLEKGNLHYILNMTEINNLNSHGIGVFLSLYKKINLSQGSLKLIQVSDTLLELFKLVSLSTIFQVYQSLDEIILPKNDNLVQIEQMGEWSVYKIATSHLQAGGNKALKNQVQENLSYNKKLIFNLTTVPFVDSLSLGVIMNIYQDIREAAGELRLVITPSHYAVFQISGFDKLLSLFNRLDDATT